MVYVVIPFFTAAVLCFGYLAAYLLYHNSLKRSAKLDKLMNYLFYAVCFLIFLCISFAVVYLIAK